MKESVKKQGLAAMMRVIAGPIRSEVDRNQLVSFARQGLFSTGEVWADSDEISIGFSMISRWMEDADRESFDALNSEWFKLFAGVGEPLVPSWANYYFDSVEHRLMGRETVRVRQFYRQFGVDVADDSKELADSLPLMLEFLAYLADLELQALKVDDLEEAVKLQEGECEFLKEHLLPWISAWRDLMLEHAESGFYRGWAYLTFGVVAEFAQLLGFTHEAQTGGFAIAAEVSF